MFVFDSHLTTTQNVDVDEDLKEKLRNSVEIKSFVFCFWAKYCSKHYSLLMKSGVATWRMLMLCCYQNFSSRKTKIEQHRVFDHFIWKLISVQ